MFDPEYRPGDNLFTNSSLGLDLNSGKIKWYFQYTPGDFLDYDEIGIQTLIVTQAGLRLGSRIGEAVRERAEQVAGVVLAVLGLVLLAERLLSSA